MFIHRNLSWHDKIFTTFMKQTCWPENGIGTLSFCYLAEDAFDMIDYNVSRIMTKRILIRRNVICLKIKFCEYNFFKEIK